MSDTTRPLNGAEARRLVQSIASDHGHIAQEVLDRMSDADRREVEHALRMKDQLISSTVVTLARNLYTSNARFVLELLQNAEDNDFTQAQEHGETPKVSFSVYPNHVVVECNEDGFTERNLRAICNVGKSSKLEAQGYIGEKGIGFKSVFMAAYRVHIHATPDENARRNQTIRQQFHEIHDTVLLFMRKIQEIKIEFYDQEKDEADEPVMTITHSIDRQGAMASCKKHTSELGREQTQLRHYHITKHTTTDLAKAEGRNYSEVEETTSAYSQSEVVLAFPVTAASVPVLENQWVFAFLPVRQMGFKFLVQADFVTQANRQDIVTTSARNQGLATGVADAFIQGVVELCDHPELRYQWMRYLPEESAYPWDGFWTQVIEEIRGRLTSTPVLCPAIPGPLQLIRDSRRHKASHLDASDDNVRPHFEGQK
ncbi:hypothetical protein NEMBOFW57_010705 [Staphylotrichum longicolle]|uniref:Uncharacterized protein n=1 Tax=Staphylotrichum longicolle TaxID=669026 RepID=A0AAD4ES23_9PEZI|nr:hypothetical protein NEMBOFW57_010705 [Staphylotrichum longicolle]